MIVHEMYLKSIGFKIVMKHIRPLAGYGLPPPPQGEFCRPYFS